MLYNTYMKFLNELDNANKYISFNIFTICGWLYLPIIIWITTFKIKSFYPIEYYLPLFIFLIIPWFITIIAFIIFLTESLRTKHLTNSFLVKNSYFKIFKYIGLILTLFFYLILIFYNPYNQS